MWQEELESWKVEWIKLDSSLGPYNATENNKIKNYRQVAVFLILECFWEEKKMGSFGVLKWARKRGEKVKLNCQIKF